MTSRSGLELPQLELDCLATLWALERAPVAAIHARLAQRGRPLAYTTVLTVLDRLRRKQVVGRERKGRAFIYHPLVSRRDMRARALERLLANYYDSRDELAQELEITLAPNRTAPARPPAGPIVADRRPSPFASLRIPEAEPEPALLD